MPIQGRFEADFSSFLAAADAANVKLTSFQANAGKVESSLTKMANSLSGTAMIQQATLMAAAVDKIGGVSVLTSAELQKLGSQASEAIEKMQKTGITQIPQNLQDIANAAKDAQKNTEGFGASLANWASGIAAQVASGELLAQMALRAGTALVDLGESAIENAVHVKDLATATGLSAEAVQRFGAVGQDFGVSTDEMARGVEQLNAKLAGGDKSAVGAVTGLGLSLKDLRASNPEQAFVAVVTATEQIQDPMLRSADLTDLFGGKLAKIIGQIPDFKAALAGISDKSIVTDASLDSIKRADVEWTHLIATLKGGLAEDFGKLIGMILPPAPSSSTGSGLPLGAPFIGGGTPTLSGFGTPFTLAPSTNEALTQLQNRIASLTAEYNNLSASQLQQIALGTKVGDDAKSIAAGMGLQEQTVQRVVEAQKQASDYGKEFAKVVQDVNDQLNGTDWDGSIDGALGLGVSVHEAAVYFGVSQSAAEQVKEQIQLLGEVAKIEGAGNIDILSTSLNNLVNIGEKVKIVIPTVKEQIAALGEGGANGAAAILEMGGTLSGSQEFINTSDPNLAYTQGTLPSAQLGGIGPIIAPAIQSIGNLDDKTQTWNKSLSEASQSLSQLAAVSGGKFGAIVKDLAEALSATNAIAAGMKSIKDAGSGLSGAVSTGAGILSIAGGAISIAESIGKALNIGGPSQAELQTRTDRTNAGLTDGTAIQTDEDALTQLGISAQQAQVLVAAALDAKTPAAFAAAMKPVNDAIALNAKLSADVTSVTSLVGAFLNAGHVLPASMVATIASLEKMPGLTKDEQDALSALSASAKPNFDTLESVAEKYGATLQGLGPKLAQGQIDQTAQGIYQDFEDLTNAGGDAGGVILAMQGKLGDLVKEAEDGGSAVPAFLKSILSNFGDTITDSNGDIVDLTKITFDNTPTTDGLADMQTQLDDLQTSLATQLPDALNALLAQIPGNPFAGWIVPIPPTSDGSASSAWTGGIVGAYGVQRFASGGRVPGGPSGTDTVPAWLTPGEMILNRDQQRSLFRNSGGGNGDVTVYTDLVLDGQVLARQTDRYQKKDLQTRRKLPRA